MGAFDESNKPARLVRGAIVALVRHEERYVESLIDRNARVERFLYDGGERMDVVLFHDAYFSAALRARVQAATPRLPLVFVNVSSEFELFESAVNPDCPPSPLSESAPPGYKVMCAFWFSGFRRHLPRSYGWMLRVDDDCLLQERFAWALPMPPRVHLAAPEWVSLDGSPDSIADPPLWLYEPERMGSVVRGLRNLTLRFAVAHRVVSDALYPHAPNATRVWPAPYTNVFYLNLDWLRSTPMVTDFMAAVEASKCVYSNRWGDLPLWGSVAALAGGPRHRFLLRYWHGSHHIMANRDPHREADHAHTTILNATVVVSLDANETRRD